MIVEADAAARGRASDVPAAWRRAAERIAARDRARVMIVGAPDTGKSTACHVLAQHLLGSGHGVAVVDADVGQKDIGPPATVGLGYPAEDRALAATPAAGLAFVGGSNPARHMMALVTGTLRLVQEADAPFVIVDTSGLVRGPGRALKAAKVNALMPDFVLALDRGDELDGLLAACRHVPTLRLKPSHRARRRSRAARAAARQAAFARYLAGARRRHLSLDRVAIQGTALFTGRRCETEAALHAEETADGLLVVAPAEGADFAEAQTYPAGFERGLVCGLADGAGRDLGLGVVERFDFAARTVHYRSPVAARATRVFKLGEERARLGT